VYWLLIALIAGVLYKITWFTVQITNNPFSQSFSDGSWMYMASMFRSQDLYGTFIGFPYKDFSKVLLQSIPFLINGLPIWVHRAWDVFLSLILTSLSSWLLVRRLKDLTNVWRWICFLGCFLFLLQGPVYNFLLIPVVMMLGWFQPKKFWRSALVLSLSTIWACLSRVNWFPVPGFIAIVLYVVETPFPQKWIDYFKRPLGWFLVAAAVASITLLLYYSYPANETLVYALATFSTPLSWRRLLPNPVYPIGLIPAIALLSLPLGILILLNIFKGGIHWLRVTLIALLVGILFIGCTVASVKFGGGNNLHNYDSYYILLLIFGAYFVSNSCTVDQPFRLLIWKPALAFVFIVPILFCLSSAVTLPRTDLDELHEEAAELSAFIDDANANGRTVLIISDRQLFAFGYTAPHPFEVEYENNLLMEMAMANDLDYLQGFYNALEAHDFDYIIVGRLFRAYQSEDTPFFAENNLWVDRVADPILVNYHVIHFYPASSLAVYMPQ
jgi:hypothetical protein